MKLVATIGTSGTFERFSRLVAEVRALRPDVELLYQAGRGAPTELPGVVDFMARDALLEHMRAADLVVCHGGLGSLRDAVAACGNVAVVPRRAGASEGVVNDHQLELAEALAGRGLVRVVSTASEIVAMLGAGRRPRGASTSPLPAAVVAALRAAMGDRAG